MKIVLKKWRTCANDECHAQAKKEDGSKCPKCSSPWRPMRSWGWTAMVEGKQKRQFNNAWATQKAAKEGYETWLAEQAKEREQVATVTFAQACERFLADRPEARTLDKMQQTAAQLQAVFGAETPLAQIDGAKIAEYRRARLATIKRGTDRKLTAAAINRPLALLRAVLRQAAVEGHLAKVPTITMPKEAEGRLRWLTPEEATRLLDACAGDPRREKRNDDLVDYVELSLFTGMRQAEVLELPWTRVDQARGVIELGSKDTKSKRRRTIPLNERSSAVLERRAKHGTEGHVFRHRSWDHYRTAWEFALKRARIEDFRPHDLRHTFASWAVQRGVTMPELKDLLGHKTVQMTMRYAHLAPENLRKASAALDGVLDAPRQPIAQSMRERAPQPLR